MLPSVNVACAVNHWFIPEGTAVDDGFTVIETTDAGVTVRRVEPLTVPSAAVIDEVPTERDVPRPDELTLATAALAELQLTDAVRSCWLPSVKVPVALNGCVVPRAIDGLAGLIVMETRATLLMVSTADPDTVPDEAEIDDCPEATLVANPTVPLMLLTVATEPFDELHWTEVVTFCVLPSLKVPVAANWTVVPSGIVEADGLTAMETSAADVTVSVAEPLTFAAVAVIVV